MWTSFSKLTAAEELVIKTYTEYLNGNGKLDDPAGV